MEVYIVRHTKLAIDNNVCYGQSNVPLAPNFLEEAKQIAAHLPEDIQAVYSSPLFRCTELAIELGFNNYQIDPRLLELNFGEWEQKSWNEIPNNQLQPWMDDFVQTAPPLGENLNEMFERVQSFFAELKKSEREKVLIVTHGGVIRCLLAYILEFPLKNIFKVPVDFGEIYVLHLDKEYAYIKKIIRV